jgi:DNA topoisomerase-1
LTKRHVTVRGKRVAFRFRAKHRAQVRTALVDPEVAEAVRELLELPGGRRLFRYERDGELYNLTGRRLNEYIQRYMGEEFSAKDFRTWGGTLQAAIEFAEYGVVETQTEQKRAIATVMRRVAERLGNTPSVTRRDGDLDVEEQALLSLLRSWRIRRARAAA